MAKPEFVKVSRATHTNGRTGQWAFCALVLSGSFNPSPKPNGHLRGIPSMVEHRLRTRYVCRLFLSTKSPSQRICGGWIRAEDRFRQCTRYPTTRLGQTCGMHLHAHLYPAATLKAAAVSSPQTSLAGTSRVQFFDQIIARALRKRRAVRNKMPHSCGPHLGHKLRRIGGKTGHQQPAKGLKNQHRLWVKHACHA